ncbi:MAG: hypothetical protein V4722_02235 [Bacteroidota bacterium]
MKKYFILFLAASIAITAGMAQGNSKNKGKDKVKIKTAKNNKGNEVNWDGTQQSGNGKLSKNQPTKVTAAFQRDYPAAGNVVWSKYRGDWTATFNSGFGWGRSTAVYHANGERRDTRTRIKINELPNRTIWDKIFKRDNIQPVDIVQIQSPTLASEIFRIASQVTGLPTKYVFYNNNGQLVQYDY